MKQLGFIYYFCCLWVLYQIYVVSKKSRKRYTSRDLVDSTGRQTADENYDYFIFEFLYLQAPLILVQMVARLIVPKKWYFGFVSFVTFVAVFAFGSSRMGLFILLAAYISYIFQAEHPGWQWSQILIGVTFAGYVRYRGAFYNTSILENQLLLATLFRMIACAPADLPKEDFSTFFQFFFYPVTITGPWITFSAFAEAKKAESFDSVSISQFTGRVARFVGYLIIGELGQHFFYLTCLSLDRRVLETMKYWNLVAFVVMCVYREMVQLYICYSFNYAIASLDGIKLIHQPNAG